MLNFSKIHSDSRGSISSLLGNLGPYPEVTIFETKKGYARGGCIHSISSEHICVLVGEICFVYGDNKESKLMKAGETLTIPPKTPHSFIALEDSVVMEWGPQMIEKKEKHLEFRAVVDEINRKKDNDSSV